MPGTTLRASPMDVQNRERSKPAEVPSADELERYESDGYLVVRQVLSDQHLDPIRRVMERTVERQADEWYEQGLIADRCRDEPFERRYGALRAQLPPTFSNSWRRILVSPEIHAVWQYPPLVGLMRRLIGDELYASVIWNGRPRAPQQPVQTIDWHQDAHYMQEYDAAADRAVGAWLPLVPVDESSGCMQVIPGSHRNGLRPEIRVPRNNLLGLDESDLAGLHPVSCPMEPGDVLLFSELIYHRSVDNVSDRTRWSLDVRYFDAANTRLAAKETQRYRGSGYYCYSATDPARVTAYEPWAAAYDYDGEF